MLLDERGFGEGNRLSRADGFSEKEKGKDPDFLKTAALFMFAAFGAVRSVSADWWEQNQNPESWGQAREALGTELQGNLS